MILKLEIMQLQRGVATPACERQNEPPSLTTFAKADKRQLYVARYNFVQNKKNTLQVSLRIPPHVRCHFILFVCFFCILEAFLRRQNSMVHNFRKNTEQFPA